jgi:hypothetical protein
MPRRLRPRLVGAPAPSDVFRDLGALCREQRMPGAPGTSERRQRATETFARIPHDRARTLYRKIGGPAWLILVELDRLIFKSRGRNPVKLPGALLQEAGLSRYARWRGLRQLEEAGVVQVERQGRGRPPWVTHLWFPRQD